MLFLRAQVSDLVISWLKLVIQLIREVRLQEAKSAETGRKKKKQGQGEVKNADAVCFV